MDPKTSGDQTSRFEVWVSKWWYIPKKVVTLKKRVPTHWIPAAQISLPWPRATRNCSDAAVVKKIEPTK